MKYGAKDNEIADKLRKAGYVDVASAEFLQSKEWKALRRVVIEAYGRQCMKCKTTPRAKNKTHVDHIKPRKRFPSLALDVGNLQVLCSRCNKNKGNQNCTDYRAQTGRLVALPEGSDVQKMIDAIR
jgi:5-methylcytosine-specific restriction endonuclease McrA